MTCMDRIIFTEQRFQFNVTCGTGECLQQEILSRGQVYNLLVAN